MDKQLIRVLNKLYSYDNKYYGDNEEDLYSEAALSEREREVLQQHGWKANEIAYFDGHDDVLEKLISLKQHPLLDKSHMARAFIAGVGGSYLHGRSALSSWHSVHTVPLHAYCEKPEYVCCWICKERDKKDVINDSKFQYILHLGNGFASSPKYAYLNLKYLSEQPAINPTDQDIQTFLKLLDLLRTAPADETPGKCEKRLKGAKFLPAAQHIRGILDSLALVGVIPNRFIALSDDSFTNWGDIAIGERHLKNTGGRSDMEMPWAGWQGSLKIDEEKADKLFGEYLK